MQQNDTKQLPKYFVFIKQNGICYPQLWMDDMVKGTGEFQYGEVSNDGPLVFFHVLTDEEKELTFDRLNEKFKEKLNEKGLVHYRDFDNSRKCGVLAGN